MDKRIAGLLGMMAALSTANAQASPGPTSVPTGALKAGSFADLLEPIQNAAAILKVADKHGPAPAATGGIQLAQAHHHHHHHHHTVVVVKRHRHHHHHQHHHHN